MHTEYENKCIEFISHNTLKNEKGTWLQFSRVFLIHWVPSEVPGILKYIVLNKLYFHLRRILCIHRCLSVCLSVCPSVFLTVCLSVLAICSVCFICLSVKGCLCLSMSVCSLCMSVSVCLYICLSVRSVWSACLCLLMSGYACLFCMSLSLSLSVGLSICLSVCLDGWMDGWITDYRFYHL